MSLRSKYVYFIISGVFYGLILLLNLNSPFFFDTIQLGSKHAHWFYETNFRYLLLPDGIDSGHIPVFGLYLALGWSVFGKSMLVSHLMMWPFVFGIIYQVYILSKKCEDKSFSLWVGLLILSDATLLGQSILCSPDVLLVFFFLVLVNELLKGKMTVLFSIALCGLVLISMRGMMVALAIYSVHLITNKDKLTLNYIIKSGLYYVPAAGIVIGFLIYHYHIKGWIGYHENSPWAECFRRVGFEEMPRNVVILIWRLLDFGRVFLWLFLGIFILMGLKNRAQLTVFFSSTVIKRVGILLLLLLLVFSYSFITYAQVNAHRYLLPVYLLFAFIVGSAVASLSIETLKRKYLFLALIILQLSGNFWVYPQHISQGWDASLAQLPYHFLRKNMNEYILANGYSPENISTDVMNMSSLKETDLAGDTSHFVFKDMSGKKLLLYSNVFNGFEKEDIADLETNWTVLHEERKCRIFLQLLKKKN